MKLADKIIQLRKQKAWSQEELAERMNVSRQSVSKWESGTSIPDIDKILLLSQIFGTTTDFLLKEDILFEEESEVQSESSNKKEMPKHHITEQEASDFLEIRKKASSRIALGVALCIISPVCMMVLLGLTRDNKFGITEHFAVAAGLTVLFLFVTIAVVLFITYSILLSKYEYIEKGIVQMNGSLTEKLKQECDSFMPVFSKSIVLGVMFCIISVIPLVIFSILENEEMTLISVGILLFIVACGVFFLVKVGIVKDSYDQMLQRNDYTAEKKMAKQKLDFIAPIYWMIVTIIYLVISFFTNKWNLTWIIWAVAGILFGIISVIIENRAKKDL